VPVVAIAPLDELRPGIGHHVRVEFWDYAVWLLPDGSVRVLDNSCEHVGGPLVDGAIKDGCVICPWHGWRYDLTTGRRRTAFGDVGGVRSYRAWVEDGRVWAELPDDPLA
jgi:nitrite reductase/ring-hydroxylating ferredoxin subunit